jgi:hypothetical protein
MMFKEIGNESKECQKQKVRKQEGKILKKLRIGMK